MRAVIPVWMAPVIAATCVVAVVHAAPDDVEIVARVEQGTVLSGADFEYTIGVEWQGAADGYRFVWPEAPVLDGLEIVGSRRAATSSVVSSSQVSRQEFTWILRPIRLGDAVIGSADVTYWVVGDTSGVGRNLSTEPLHVTVEEPDGGPGVGSLAVGVFALLVVGVLGGWFRIANRRRSARRIARRDPRDEDMIRCIDAASEAARSGDPVAFGEAATAALRIAGERFGSGSDALAALAGDVERIRYSPGAVPTEELELRARMLRLMALSMSEESDDAGK